MEASLISWKYYLYLNYNHKNRCKVILLIFLDTFNNQISKNVLGNGVHYWPLLYCLYKNLFFYNTLDQEIINLIILIFDSDLVSKKMLFSLSKIFLNLTLADDIEVKSIAKEKCTDWIIREQQKKAFYNSIL